MTYRHCSVGVQQHHCKGLSKDRATPYNDRVLSLDINAVVIQQPHDAGGRSRTVSRLVHGHRAKTKNGDTINILFERDSVKALPLVNLWGNGMLEQNALNPRIEIEFVNLREELACRCSLRQDNPE